MLSVLPWLTHDGLKGRSVIHSHYHCLLSSGSLILKLSELSYFICLSLTMQDIIYIFSHIIYSTNEKYYLTTGATLYVTLLFLTLIVLPKYLKTVLPQIFFYHSKCLYRRWSFLIFVCVTLYWEYRALLCLPKVII